MSGNQLGLILDTYEGIAQRGWGIQIRDQLNFNINVPRWKVQVRRRNNDTGETIYFDDLSFQHIDLSVALRKTIDNILIFETEAQEFPV